jgi:hypothetical protein
MPDTKEFGEFEADRRDAFHPFSYGPRMCPARKYVVAVSNDVDIS